jgi:hypothetical protein
MKKITPIALSVLALAAAGCGSSSSKLSDAAFTSKADAICNAANAATAKLSGSGGAAAVKSAEELLSTMIGRLQALSPPADRAAAFSSFLTEVKYVESLLKQLGAAAAARDSAKIASIETQVPGFESKGKAEATAAGIKSCD